MPGREYGAPNRYGFNRQERSTELNKNSYTAEFWQYDSRIARRWNVDPVLKEYESPYMCFAGNPILLSDPDGDCAGGGDCPHCGRNHNPSGGGNLIAVAENWLYGIKVDLTCGKRWNEAARNVNQLINPVYIVPDHVSKIVRKKDLEGNPIDQRGRQGAISDAGVDAMAYITGERFFKIFGSYSTNALEAELNSTKRALETPGTNKPVLQVADEVSPLQMQPVQQWQASGRPKVPPSVILGRNLEAGGVQRPANSAAHHIVAYGDERAAVARDILKRENIDINDAINGVFLPKNSKYLNPPAATHSKLHTDGYYEKLTERLQNAKPGKVNAELKKIKTELLKGTF